MSVLRICGKAGPHGAICMKLAPHERAAALSESLHRDNFGNEWTDVPVATPLSTAAPEKQHGLGQWAPPPVVAPTIATMAAKCTERLAVLDRVRPILNEAIRDAKPEDAAAWAIVAVRVSEAILRDGGR